MYFDPNKKEKDIDSSLYVLMTAVIAVLLIAMIVYLIIGAPKKDTDKDAETDPPVEEAPLPVAVREADPVPTAAQTSKIIPTILPESRDAGQEYIDRIVFLGDSTTYGLKKYAMLKDGRDTTQVWTPSNGTLTLADVEVAKIYYPDTDEEITIKEAVERKMPDIMVITLGVNGLSFMKEDFFIQCYKKAVDTVKTASPDTKIILQSIFPVALSYEHQDQINNTKILAANSWIKQIAEEKGVHYLDTASVLADSDGFLPEDYHNGDGLHLNEKSFGIQLLYTRTHALED